jgi:hypothetical protein
LRFNVANRFCWSKQNKQMDYKIVSRTFNKYIYMCSNQMYVHVIHVSCSWQQVNPTSVAVWDALERLLAARASFARVRLPSHLTMTVPSHRSESCPEQSCPRHSLRFHQKFCRVLALAKDRTTAKRGENNRLDGAQYGIRTWTQSTQSMCIQCAFNVHSMCIQYLLRDVHSEAKSWRHTIQGAHTGGSFAPLIHPSHCKPEAASNSTSQTDHEVQLVHVRCVLTNVVSRATSLLFLQALLCK